MKNSLNIYVRIVVYSLLALLIFLNISSVFFLVELNSNISTINNGVDHLIQSILTYYKFHIILECFLLAMVIVLLFLVSKNLYKKFIHNKLRQKNLEEKHKKEIELQNKLLKDITCLYDTTVKTSNLKSEFFYNMSHELKTPLTVILGAIQLIEQKNSFAEPDRRFATKHHITIKQNCYRLLRLINNILDLSRIESGYIKTSRINCNIVYLIEEIVQSVVPYAEQKCQILEFDTLKEEIITSVDVDKIERIILNLLSNAIKYTKPGGKISIKVALKHNNVIIVVKDSGIGIPSNMLETIFERYRQVNSSLTAGIEGSGIGLSIVKSFVELHEGVIKVKSQQNKGSEFIIKIPVKLEESSPEETINKNESQNKIIEAINIEFSDIYTVA